MLRCQALIKIFFLFCFFLAKPIFASDFLTGTEDVPLMQGLALSEDETFDFENEDGRLYFSKAYTKDESEKVQKFYEETLPQLGWQRTDEGYSREGDTLRISVTDGSFHAQKLTSVIFELIIKSK